MEQSNVPIETPPAYTIHKDGIVAIGGLLMTKSCENLSKALLEAQKVITPAVKDSLNDACQSAFASLTAVLAVVKPALTDAGVTMLQPVSVDGHNVTVTTILMKGEQWMASSLTIHAGSQEPWAIGSATSYAQRYGVKALLAIPSTDDDAQGAMPAGATNSLSRGSRSRPSAASVEASVASVVREAQAQAQAQQENHVAQKAIETQAAEPAALPTTQQSEQSAPAHPPQAPIAHHIPAIKTLQEYAKPEARNGFRGRALMAPAAMGRSPEGRKQIFAIMRMIRDRKREEIPMLEKAFNEGTATLREFMGIAIAYFTAERDGFTDPQGRSLTQEFHALLEELSNEFEQQAVPA